MMLPGYCYFLFRSLFGGIMYKMRAKVKVMIVRWRTLNLKKDQGLKIENRSYCWWFRNPAPLVIYPIIYRALYIQTVVVWGFWTISSIMVVWELFSAFEMDRVSLAGSTCPMHGAIIGYVHGMLWAVMSPNVKNVLSKVECLYLKKYSLNNFPQIFRTSSEVVCFWYAVPLES